MPTAAYMRKRVAGVLNAMATSAGAVAMPDNTDDPAYPNEQVDEYVKLAAQELVALIALIPNHPLLSFLLSETTAVTHGGEIPAHIGPVYAARVSFDDLTWLPAVVDAPDAIQRYRDEKLAGTLTLSYRAFAVDGFRCWQTGNSAKFDVVSLTSLTFPDDIPDSLVDAVVALALAYLIMLEGANVTAGQQFHAMALRHVETQAQLARDAVAAAKAFQINPLLNVQWAGGK
jgi:hypothetical protein